MRTGKLFHPAAPWMELAAKRARAWRAPERSPPTRHPAFARPAVKQFQNRSSLIRSAPEPSGGGGEDHYWAFFIFMIPIIAIVGGITTAIVSTVMRARVRELEIRERIAMIERGLVPPPEKDPQGFERAMSRYEQARPSIVDWPGGRTPARYRSAGIQLGGVGLGLMLN